MPGAPKIYNDNIESIAHSGQATEGSITFNFYLFYTWLKLLGKL